MHNITKNYVNNQMTDGILSQKEQVIYHTEISAIININNNTIKHITNVPAKIWKSVKLQKPVMRNANLYKTLLPKLA